jgi:hypothetical protein
MSTITTAHPFNNFLSLHEVDQRKLLIDYLKQSILVNDGDYEEIYDSLLWSFRYYDGEDKNLSTAYDYLLEEFEIFIDEAEKLINAEYRNNR